MYEVDVAHGVNELRQKLLNLASPWYLHSVMTDGTEGKFIIIARLGKQEPPLSTAQATPHPEDFKRW